MRAEFSLDYNSLSNFNARCEAAINRVGNGSRKALVEACNEIIENSLAQVPYATGTLGLSAFWEITGSYKTLWEASLGYGGNGDPVNPKTGKPASSYALIVHEDLYAHHPIGKAKFLEDPVREYAREKYPRTVFRYAQESLAGMSD